MTPVELRTRREALGLSQTEAARVLGVKQNTISGWESGKRAVPAHLNAELTLLEQRVLTLQDRMTEWLDGRNPDDTVFIVHERDETFWMEHPEHEGLPAVMQRVAAARVRAEFALDGIEIPIVGWDELNPAD